jgi:APA family basic amino acid/polyamine antiporter
VSAPAVASSWTGYFVSLLNHVGIHLPDMLTNRRLMRIETHGRIMNLPQSASWRC